MPADASDSRDLDVKVIQGAYEDGLKNLFSVYFDGCIDDHQAAESRFIKGLGILRDARKRASELVKAP